MIESDAAMIHALRLVRGVCQLAGPFALIDDVRASLKREGVVAAVNQHDSATLFDWLMNELSYQGISDRIAEQYLDQHGNITWADVEFALTNKPSCSQLGGYWLFFDCQYQKWSGSCAEPDHIPACPLPRHPLRNGRLNQTAYSLFLFIRDIAGGDLVQWIDDQLREYESQPTADQIAAMRASLVEPLREIYGVSDKVITMAVSSLLIGAGARRHVWFETGARFVVIDTLVHNFLHRTGILHRFNADDAYGPACYRLHGCADLVERIADHIDARTFNPRFPNTFPRFVQLAIWRYCSQGGLDICNGNRIDDQVRCENLHCQLYSSCDRVKLHKTSKNSVNSIV